MAAASGPFYKFELVKRLWYEQLRRTPQRFFGEDYFNHFILHHGDFDFYVFKTYDGTSQLMLDEEQYLSVKRRLEEKTRVSLNEITSRLFLDGKSNALEGRKQFSSQQEFNRLLDNLKENEKLVYKRACQKASEKKSKLRQMLNNNPNMKFITFDLEVYDKDCTTVLEIGYAKFTLKEGDKPEYFHAIVNEDLHNRENLDNKEKFMFGTSAHMSLKEAAAFLQRSVAGSDALVTQSGFHDDKCLIDNDIIIAKKTMFETQALALALLPPQNPTLICWDLNQILREFDISYDETILHNAGNDAHYTMLAFKALAKIVTSGSRFQMTS